MNITHKRPAAFVTIAFSLLTGLLITGFSRTACADDLPDSAPVAKRPTCAYSLMLQKSVAAQRQYLVKRDEAIGAARTASDDNSVEKREEIRTASTTRGELDASLGL